MRLAALPLALRRPFAAWLALGVAAFAWSPASADVLARHQGATNPETEGFARRAGVLSAEAVTADLGYDAWRVTGCCNTGDYVASIDLDAAYDTGWRLRARSRIASGSGVGYASVINGSGRSFLTYTRNVGADAVVGFSASDLSYTLPGRAGTWIDIEVVYDAVTQRATLSVDGGARVIDYPGVAGWGGEPGFYFGAYDASVSFNLAEFSTDTATGPVLSSLTLKKPIVAGCKPVVGTVTLSAPAPAGGAVVALSETLASGSVPASVTIPAGATSKTFKVTTAARADSEAATVSATYGGVTLSKPLTVRPISVLSIPITPTTLVGGGVSSGVVKLECKAAPGPILVEFGSTLPAVASTTVPNVLIPAGVQTAPVTVTTSPVTATKKPKITASANGLTKSKTLTVTP